MGTKILAFALFVCLIILGVAGATTVDNASLAVQTSNTFNGIAISTGVPSPITLGSSANVLILLNNVIVTNVTLGPTSHILISPAGNTLISAPPANTIPHQVVVVQNGQPNRTINNVTVVAPPKISTALNLNSSYSYQSNTLTPLSNVTFSYTIGRIPLLGLIKTLYPGNVFTNATIGYSFSGAWPTMNTTVNLPIGGSYLTPTGMLIKAPTGSQIAHNITDLEPIVSSLAVGCSPNTNVTLRDTGTNSSLTLCGTNAFTMWASFILSTKGNLSDDIGRAMQGIATTDNGSAQQWKNSDSSCEATLNQTITTDRSNYLALNLTYTYCHANETGQQAGTQGSITTIEVFVGAACVIIAGWMFTDWYKKKDAARKGGH